VRGLIGVSATTDEAEVRETLRRASQELAGAQWAETYAYLGHLLSLELEPEMRARISSLEIEVVKRYVAGLVHLVRGRTADGPLVLVLEDLHWADPASVMAMLQFLPLLADVPVLSVMTSRIDRDADGWRLISGARDLFGDALTEIRLEPLSTEDSRTLVSQLLAIESLPQTTREQILAKAEGNPFFVEEVIRMLIDRGAIGREGDRWVATASAAAVDIPDTLQGLLLARIDRLPVESKRTLRVASVIGRQFGVTMLERLLAERSP
jgi:predicted ATPase